MFSGLDANDLIETRAIEKSLPTRTGLQAGPLFFFLVRRGMGYAHTSPHQKENERAAGATFQWPCIEPGAMAYFYTFLIRNRL